jgi:hypothetical protein
MKDIQIITSGYKVNKYTTLFDFASISNFSSPKSFDGFKINVFDLSEPDVFAYEVNTLRKSADFCSIRTMIENSSSTKFLFCLPMNISISGNGYLKNNIKTINAVIKSMTHINDLSLFYENTDSKIFDEQVESNFAFSSDANILIKSTSGKTTTIECLDMIFTTSKILDEENSNLLMKFLECIGLYKSSIDIPQWLIDYSFFDDKQQNESILKSQKIIEEENAKIEQAKQNLEKNMLYKSILITNGDKLVNVVTEILENIFEISLKDFVDNKREDFLFEKDGATYLGEIKGVTTNVKHSNITQLSVHYSNYLDELQEQNIEVGEVKKLLIVNYERNKDISERDEVNEMQIKLAKKQETLIIDTKSLLDLYALLLNGSISRESIIDYINNNFGLIDVKKIKRNKR